jgi:hypothetical protein
MERKKRKESKDATCRDIALRACHELLTAAEASPAHPNVNRALVLARYAIALRP